MAENKGAGKFFQFFNNFYAGQLKPNQAGECKVKSFCHADKHESMAINVNTGLWNCFACDDMGGDPIDFYIAWREKVDSVKVKFGVAVAKASEIAGFDLREKKADGKKYTQSEEYKQEKKEAEENIKPISKTKVDKWHEMLMNTPKALDILKQKRGYTEDTIKRYNLGWDGDRITIPIPDENFNIMNVRRYKADEKNAKLKMVSISEGYGRARLFPIANLQHQTIVLCEGELDAILANQMGYFAVTVTGGVGTWREEFTELFTGKDVVIIYDVDKQGRQGANKITDILADVAKSVKNVILPIVADIPNGDFTDYFISLGNGKTDLDNLIENTAYYKKSYKEDFTNDDIPELHLSEVSKAQYADRRIRTKTVVAGKDTAPYLIPKKIHVKCMGDGSKCDTCRMMGMGMSGKTIDIKPNQRDILNMVNVNDRQKKYIISELSGINTTCQSWEFEVLESQNVEKVILMPELDYSEKEKPYILFTSYIVGNGIQTNSSYILEGVVVSDPKQQYATLIVDEYRQMEDDVKNFQMSEEIHEKLKAFQVEEGQTVKEKFDEIHADLSHNITRIYGRNDIMTATDLTFHSALAFEFEGKEENRGWVETLIIGDTRTGKSETVMSLRKHYKMGEFITGENVSFAGLIGGLQSAGSSGRWTLTWGKIPLNDSRLVVIDEASGIPTNDIERMSGVRSSGIAEITKIQTERTHARTRLIWISNDRSGRGLQYYGYGTDAVKQLIGKAEDIARFEIVVTAGKDEVDLSIINKKMSEREEVPHFYTSELCHDLVLWAWSREKDQIIFTPEAIDLLFKYATEQGTFYTNEFPLVEGANQRIKLARMAIATAARVYSTDDGENIIVKPEHVDFVNDFVNEVYKKQSLGYWNLSKQKENQRQKAEAATGEIMNLLNDFPDLGDIFLENNVIGLRDIADIMNVMEHEARKYLNMLARNRMVAKTSSGYRKQPTFIKLLREWKQLQGY